MSIIAQGSQVEYSGNASTSTPYPIPFRYDDSSWVVVEEVSSDATVTRLIQGTHYTLTGSGTATAGNVVTGNRAIPIGSNLRISRHTVLSQNVSLAATGAIPSTVIEAEFDKLTMAHIDSTRRHDDGLERALRVPYGEPPLADFPAAKARAGLYPGFAADGSLRLVPAHTILAEVNGEPNGVSFPNGGATGQLLAKASNADAHTKWITGPTEFNVTDHGVAADGQLRTDGSAAAGDNTITSASANFPADIVGKHFRMEDVGAAGADLIGTVTARNSATSIEVSVAPSSSANGKTFIFGTDNTAAVQTLINVAYSSPTTRTLYFPPGIYILNTRIRSQVTMRGDHKGNILHGIPNPTNLCHRGVTPTVLLPALATTPVIYGDDDYDATYPNGAFGSRVEGFSIVGSAKKTGYGIRLGHGWGDTGFSSARAVVTHCNADGFNVGISHGNAVDGEISHCWCNECNVPFEIWRHDGIILRNISSTWSTTAIKIGGSKNVLIQSGNFNFINDYWLDVEDSQVTVLTVNVEDNAGGGWNMIAAIAVRQLGGTVDLSVDFIKVLGSPGAVLLRNFIPNPNAYQSSIRINRAIGVIYYDTINEQIPIALGGVDRIRYYTSSAFTTVRNTDKVRRVYMTTREGEQGSRLREDFVSRLATSPYGELGWVMTGISGSFNVQVPLNQLTGMVRLISSSTSATNVGRFALSHAVIQPPNQHFWRLRYRFNLELQATAVWRCGFYSLSSSLLPEAGLGIRVDTSGSTPDPTVKFEILNGSVPVGVVDTTVPIASISANSEVILQRTAQGVSCYLRSEAGGAYAPEVLYTSPLPAWAGYMSPAVYMGVSTAAYAACSLTEMDFIKYPVGTASEWQ
jgi:hypothetical protein